ncbi:thioredoxin-disulfide reductase [Candidatus Woesebacteria bacterium GWB1_43_5]|uniref:Thioredoxin reductase n=1 Tax=Candidatus Woesebacteria bacterium GWB1_43_5 TaxID=1802474 RepID=A0A1F7WSM8_9BACT|nr:MAG: thioredoxin-disulfide reductase [Candidatus Woesebacteria bacterium GWB1_43_5]
MAIVGSGPSGLTAAIYTTRGAASTIIFAGERWGGQLMLTTTIDNYPALPSVQGPDLMQKMKDHALSFGAEFIQKNVENIELGKAPFELTVAGQRFLAKSVIVATGADTKWLGVPGEKELIGRGVSSCAPCDAPFFKQKNVMVVGGGDSAMEEAMVLTKYAILVTIVHRRGEFRASAAMQAKVSAEEKNGKIKIIWDSEITQFIGRDKLDRVTVKNIKDGKEREVAIDGVFVAIGHVPSTKIFQGKLALDEKGYIKKVPIDTFQMSTSIPGVFVAGDVHDYHYRQAITAAGFGCQAGMDALVFLDKPTPSW